MNNYVRPVTPLVTSNQVLAFCKNLVPDGTPRYVVSQPISGVPINECFVIVEEQIRLRGGQSVVGWEIGHWPGLFLGAVFHAVWQTSEGNWIDITPKAFQSERILFLPDPSRRYEGQKASK